MIAQRMEYQYDAAGNRVMKQITLSPKRTPKSLAPARDRVANIGLTISPNPTTGQLRISAPDLAEGDKGTVSVYGPAGNLLLRKQMHQRITTIDIGAAPRGVYILSTEINGIRSNWRVIKQ